MSSFTINDDVKLTSSASIDNVRLSGNTISSTNTDGHIVLAPNGNGTVQTDNLQLDGNTISSTDTDGHIVLAPNGNGNVGIGTSSPNTSLHVDGYQTFYDSTLLPGQNTTGSDLVPSKIILGNEYGPQIRTRYPNGSWTDGVDLEFCTAGQNIATDNSSSRLTIKSLNGNVGIGTTSPAQTLDIDGTVTHKGLVLSEGTTPNVDEIKTFALHLEPNTSTWINTGIQSTSLATGTYIVEVYSYSTSTSNTGNLGFYDMRFSGIMSWISNTSGVFVDYNEILLHSTGRDNNGNVIYLRTASSGGILVLQMKTSTRNTSFNPANPSYNNFTFKFRRMI